MDRAKSKQAYTSLEAKKCSPEYSVDKLIAQQLPTQTVGGKSADLTKTNIYFRLYHTIL